MTATTVSDETFGREVLAFSTPVLVEFTSRQAPVNASLDVVNEPAPAQIKLVRVDVDRSPELRDEYGIRGLPTFILFKYGKPVSRRVGAVASKAELDEWIDGALILSLATRKFTTAQPPTHFKLGNGMQVIVMPDHRAPAVTHMVWYKAGTADEQVGFSGLARLVQHLSYKSLGMSGARPGGLFNADMHRDMSCFWQRVPKGQLRAVMEREAGRMTELRFTDEDIATEREVILEARRSFLDNDAEARLLAKAYASLYRGHPYGVPELGIAEEIERLSREDALRFHKQYYAPHKAIAVIAGDVTVEEAKRLAEDVYGKIPKNKAAARRGRPKIPAQLDARRVTLEDPRSDTARFYRIYTVPVRERAEPGEVYALKLLTHILANGAASRLYRRLVMDDKVATGVAGRMYLNAVEAGEIRLKVVTTDAQLADVEAAVDAVIKEIRTNGITQEELRRTKRAQIAEHTYNAGDQLAFARFYASNLALDSTLEEAQLVAEDISRVTAAEVATVAKTYLIPRRSVTATLTRKRAVIAPSRVAALAAERRRV